MVNFKFLWSLIILMMSLLLLNGCGYQCGSIKNPQIKTIAIAPIKNETYYQDLSTYLKQLLSERFMYDGGLKVKTMYAADAILYGRIVNVQVTQKNVQVNPYGGPDVGVTYMTNEYQANVIFEFSVIIPGRVNPVIQTTTVNEYAQFMVPVDLNPARQVGIQQACRTVAQKVVSICTEGF